MCTVWAHRVVLVLWWDRCNPEWLEWPGFVIRCYFEWFNEIKCDQNDLVWFRIDVIKYVSEWSSVIKYDSEWSSVIKYVSEWFSVIKYASEWFSVINMYPFSKPLLFIFFFSSSSGCVHNNTEKWRSGKSSITWVDERWTQAGHKVDARLDKR